MKYVFFPILLLAKMSLMMSACEEHSHHSPLDRGSAHFVLVSPAHAVVEINSVRLTISGDGISPDIVAEIPESAPNEWSGIVSDIPAGTNRTFVAEALDENGDLLFQGTTSEVTVTADDTISVVINMTSVNPPEAFENSVPIITSFVATRFDVTPGETITFRVEAFDANPEDTLTYQWGSGGGPFSHPQSPITEWTAPDRPSGYHVFITVSDQHGASSRLVITMNVVPPAGSAEVSVSINTAPEISNLVPASYPLKVWHSTRLFLTVFDAESDPLTFNWEADCIGSFNDDTIEDPVFTLRESTEGTCILTVVVTDGVNSNSASLTIQIGPGVTPIEAPPGCDKELTFPDSGLEEAVRDAIGKPTGPIYYADVVGVQTLGAFNLGIVDLTGIECLNELTSLGIHSNNISDLSPISTLYNLTSLAIFDNDIADLSPLSTLTNLTGLTAHHNQISDISPLSGLTQMEDLMLMGNDISDIAPLSGMMPLHSLNLFGNNVTDLSPIENLVNLNSLHVQGNNINDITVLVTSNWIGSDDIIILNGNPLDCDDPDTQATLIYLEAEGVDLSHDCGELP